MLQVIYLNRFKNDLKVVEKRKKDLQKLTTFIALLISKNIIPIKYKNHKLHGKFSNCWECHIEPNWLLIYEITNTELILIRTGTHTDLFK